MISMIPVMEFYCWSSWAPLDRVQSKMSPTISFSGMYRKPFMYHSNRTNSRKRDQIYLLIWLLWFYIRLLLGIRMYYKINFKYKNVTQCAFFFVYTYVTQSVQISVYKNVTESALFFLYKSLTQSALFFVHKNATLPPQISKIPWKFVQRKVSGFFVYENVT